MTRLEGMEAVLLLPFLWLASGCWACAWATVKGIWNEPAPAKPPKPVHVHWFAQCDKADIPLTANGGRLETPKSAVSGGVRKDRSPEASADDGAQSDEEAK